MSEVPVVVNANGKMYHKWFLLGFVIVAFRG